MYGLYPSLVFVVGSLLGVESPHVANIIIFQSETNWLFPKSSSRINGQSSMNKTPLLRGTGDRRCRHYLNSLCQFFLRGLVIREWKWNSQIWPQ